MQGTLVVYYCDSSYALYKVDGGAHRRLQTSSSFRLIFRVKRKDKANA
jgi:hypothetical protein